MNTICCIVDCIFQKGFYCSPKLFLVLFVKLYNSVYVFLLKCSFYKVEGFLYFFLAFMKTSLLPMLLGNLINSCLTL